LNSVSFLSGVVLDLQLRLSSGVAYGQRFDLMNWVAV
jgi:hypothetical protein